MYKMLAEKQFNRSIDYSYFVSLYARLFLNVHTNIRDVGVDVKVSYYAMIIRQCLLPSRAGKCAIIGTCISNMEL